METLCGISTLASAVNAAPTENAALKINASVNSITSVYWMFVVSTSASGHVPTGHV